MKAVPLEDEFHDVLGKAQRGVGLTDDQLARQAKVSPGQVRAAKEGVLDEPSLRQIAIALGLAPKPLIELAKKQWQPSPVDLPGLEMFNTPYADGLSVNAYFVWDVHSANGVCFDTGADSAPMVAFAESRGIRVQLILLTHTHEDHVRDLRKLVALTDAKPFVSKLEPIADADTFDYGRNFRVGSLVVGTHRTSGHSVGGTAYVIEGLGRPVAVVGDALFSASMGSGLVSYADALRNNREQILTLPDDTIVCPGHGPMTTVGEEKVHNPFFAAQV